MNRIKWCKPIALIICLSLFTGCWDRTEINELALVMASGFDLAEDGQLEVTLQIALPKGIPGGMQGGGQGEKPVVVVTAKGKDDLDILSKLQMRLSRKLSFAHRAIVIFGEKYARHGIDQALDELLRNPESRYSTYILTAHGATAKQILHSPYILEHIPAIGLKKMQSSGLSLAVKLDEFLNAIPSPGMSPTTGAIRLIDGRNADAPFQIGEVAVYQENKLVGFLSKDEVKTFRWLKGKFKGEKITTQVEPKEQAFKGTVSIEVSQDKTTISTKIKGEVPEVTATFKAKGRVMENDTRLDLSKSENLKLVQSKLSDEMQKKIESMFNHVQKQLKSDIFGFGEEIHIEHAAFWKKIKNQWKDIYPQIPVQIKVDVSIERVGKTQAPAHLKKLD